MRTDGLYAFDAETRRQIERILAPQSKRRAAKAKEYRERKRAAQPPSPPRQRKEGVTTSAARRWLEHKAAGGALTQRQWAALNQVKETSMTAALFYLRNPHAREAKNAALRRKKT